MRQLKTVNDFQEYFKDLAPETKVVATWEGLQDEAIYPFMRDGTVVLDVDNGDYARGKQ